MRFASRVRVFGSMAGSSTQSGKFQIDWARVDVVPEPTTLALLAFGAIPMLRRRR